ncbi:MAG TPA: hypothetical protein VEJ84_20445 [Acidimicrobiales bacterium]|nr:hypothetical protein [Acidimicrobiales bacterium]
MERPRFEGPATSGEAGKYAKAVGWFALLGVPILIAGFAVNPGPPLGDTTGQLVAYGLNHRSALTVGGWLQVTGTVLTVVFALAVVVIARRTASLAGVLVLLGSAILIAIGLSELTVYKALATGHASTVRVAADLLPGVQLGYSIVAAPLVFGALGCLVLQARILPAIFGYLAVGFALVFWVCGLITVVTSIQGFIDVLSGVQAVWWIGAGVFVVVRGLMLQGVDPPLGSSTAQGAETVPPG